MVTKNRSCFWKKKKIYKSVYVVIIYTLFINYRHHFPLLFLFCWSIAKWYGGGFWYHDHRFESYYSKNKNNKGKMAEWFKALILKINHLLWCRGFESHSFRFYFLLIWLKWKKKDFLNINLCVNMKLIFEII